VYLSLYTEQHRLPSVYLITEGVKVYLTS